MKYNAPFSVDFTHRLRSTHDVWNHDNPVLADSIPDHADPSDLPGRVLICIDVGVVNALPEILAKIETYCSRHRSVMTLAGPIEVIPGGEPAKNDWKVVEAIVSAIHSTGLCRQSYVIAIGGGAVLDAVGFAAAIAHRGVRLIRIPTTTLAQCDSGVGVKNGVNAFGKKNFLGSFAPPWAVINDAALLESLSDRDWRCGFSEAVKVALVKDRTLFERIAENTGVITNRDPKVSTEILRRSAELHLRHIVEGGDPFELTRARPLDFGHWAGHKLEQMTDFRLRHGEAVGIGIALDVCYSTMIGLLNESVETDILRVLGELGFELFDESMRDTDRLFEGLDEFRQHLGGRLTVTLLRDIADPVDVHRIDRDKMRQAVERMSNAYDTGVIPGENCEPQPT